MANINDFKLLNLKCLNYYSLLETELGQEFSLPTEKHKERFGFYLLMLEALCNIKDTSDQLAILTDQEFNKIIFNKADDDFGVDAIYIDENTNYINFFNFKFRNEFNPNSGQGINDAFLSSKLTNAIMSSDLSALSGKTKELCKQVIKKLNSKEVWRLRLYAISNEIKELNVDSMEITQLRNLYDLETESINLKTIVNYMSIRPEPIDAILHLNQSSILPYSENPLSSSKSYVISVPATELIRITCNNKPYREDYGMEDFGSLKDIDMDYNLLFDNVRGLIVNSKFNDNIFKTLKDEPSKFFMYNNGLTLTASDIISEDTNGNTKIKITIKDFQVVNGGQTLRTLHKFNSEDEENITSYLSKVEILLRIFKTPSTNNLRNKIAQFTNSQNAISNIDLKSLTSEQIHIEQFLSEQKIVYARKIGDTGIDPSIEYTHKISMEKFGQILFAIQGYPEKASNQKKQIFDKHYDRTFNDGTFEIGKSAEIVRRFFEIKSVYENLENYPSSDQKVFFIMYIDTKLTQSIEELIVFFENILNEYRNDEEISEARKLINTRLKEVVDEKISEED